MLKDKSVSREEFSRIQDELDKKEEQIQRLNEVKDLFFEISGTEAFASEIKGSPAEKLNPTSLDNKSLDELNEIKRELELAKENKVRFKVVEDTDDDDDGIINVEASSKDDELKEKDEALESMKANNEGLNKELTDLKAEIEALKNNTEVDDLRAEINEYKDSMEEFEKIKDLYEKLTAPQLKNLNSIQSQIYQLLPDDEEMDTLAVKNYINEVAFKNVSFGNIKNILKSLERKGYVEVTKTEDNVTFWKKIELEN